jgi:hypothetical protein
MALLSLAVIGMLASPVPAQDCVATGAVPVTLVAQVVDELWLPLPGARVTIHEHGKTPSSACATADAAGFVRFSVTKPGTYDVEATMIGFKPARIKKVGVDADPDKSIPHVQVKLKVAAPKDII